MEDLFGFIFRWIGFFIIEIVFFYIGLFFLKIFTFGKYKNNANKNTHIIEAFGFLCIIILIMLFIYTRN
jgi:hypothetical protein